MTSAKIIGLPESRISEREHSARLIRDAIMSENTNLDPEKHTIVFGGSVGGQSISLYHWFEGEYPNRWALKVGEIKDEVLIVTWLPNDDRNLEIVTFKRGDWEKELLQAVENPA